MQSKLMSPVAKIIFQQTKGRFEGEFLFCFMSYIYSPLKGLLFTLQFKVQVYLEEKFEKNGDWFHSDKKAS
jgi:hypothetical protein